MNKSIKIILTVKSYNKLIFKTVVYTASKTIKFNNK